MAEYRRILPFLTLLTVAHAAVPEGHIFPSISLVESDVQWRQIDSFWKGNGSHVDLYNVAVKGHKLEIFLPNSDDVARVKELFSHFQASNELPSYSRATQKLDNFDIVIKTQALNPKTCDVKIDGSTFLDSPWYHNVYHAHAKNMIPMASVILTTPSLVPGAGRCLALPCRKQLPERHLIHHFVPDHTQRLITKVHFALFDDTKVLDSIRNSGKRHCYRHLSWGPGTEMFAVDGYEDHYVREGRITMTALRKFAMKKYLRNQPRARMADSNTRNKQQKLIALWISRQPKDTKGQIQTGRNRWIQNPDVLRLAFESHPNVEVVECCDWNKVTMEGMLQKLTTADIVYGLHGAGLANALYARKGVKLIEIVGNYGGNSNFYTRIAAARYGDWIRATVPASNHVPEDMAKALAACSVALWLEARPVNTQEYYPAPDACKYPGVELVRTTVEILHEEQAGERLPLKKVKIAPCDASPRCRIQQLGPGGALRMMGIEVDEHGKPVIGPDGKWMRSKEGPLMRKEDKPPPLRPQHQGL